MDEERQEEMEREVEEEEAVKKLGVPINVRVKPRIVHLADCYMVVMHQTHLLIIQEAEAD